MPFKYKQKNKRELVKLTQHVIRKKKFLENHNLLKSRNRLFCIGKLTNACGLGGLFKHHSREL